MREERREERIEGAGKEEEEEEEEEVDVEGQVLPI